MTPASVHLVVPCYKESNRIGTFLPDLCAALDGIGGVTVLIVEDGAGHAEQARMSELIGGWRKQSACLLPPLLLRENIGKGGAVYAGWEACAGAEWLGFVDADGSCPAGEVVRLIEMARRETTPPHALFASRIKMLGHTIERDLKRHLLGRIYATLVSEILDLPVYDSQCGLKLVPTAAFEKVKPLLSIRGFAFDAELLLALLRTRCEVIEVPIDWHETPGGKIRLVRDALRMTRDVLALRSRAASSAWPRQLPHDP